MKFLIEVDMSGDPYEEGRFVSAMLIVNPASFGEVQGEEIVVMDGPDLASALAGATTEIEDRS